MSNNQKLTEPTRKELRNQLFKQLVKFMSYTVILVGIFLLLLAITNDLIEWMDWNENIVYILMIGYAIFCTWIWFRKVCPLLVNEHSDESDIADLVSNLGYLNGIDTFMQNMDIHAKIKSVGKEVYLYALDKIIRNKRRDWIMFQWFYTFIMVYLVIFSILQANDPIYQLEPYMIYFDIGIVCFIWGLWIWNWKRRQKITQLQALGDLIDHYYDNQ